MHKIFFILSQLKKTIGASKGMYFYFYYMFILLLQEMK